MHHLLYSLYLLPLLALALFIFLPFSQALILYFPILVVYSIVYWVVWKDRHRPVTLGVEGMIGEIWDAICVEPISKAEKVEITGMERMKLIVKPGQAHKQME